MSPSDLYARVERMHKHFGIAGANDTAPAALSPDECEFRVMCMQEEVQEYIDASAEAKLEGQLDALVDLVVFAVGTAERQGFKEFSVAVDRVIRKNMQKQLASKAADSKRNFAIDLIKPPYWRDPYLGDLVRPVQAHKDGRTPRGIILLDGPDHCGKTTLAEHLKANYDAHVIHSTWSTELEPHMAQYINQSIDDAIEISKRQLVVLDRSWLSDYVYDNVYRDGRNIKVDENGYTWHNRALKKFNSAGGVIVLCIPDDVETAVAEFNAEKKQRNEMYSDNMRQVHEWYWALFNDTYDKEHAKTSPIFYGKKTSKSPLIIKYDYLKSKADAEYFDSGTSRLIKMATELHNESR